MRYIAAYILHTLAGKKEPEAEDLINILSSVGIEADINKAKEVIQAIDCRDINELIAEGMTKLATIPTGGAASAAGPVSAAPVATAAKEEIKEAAKESSSESDAEMGFGLFD